MSCCTLPASLTLRPSFVLSRRMISSWMTCIFFSISNTFRALPSKSSWACCKVFLHVFDGLLHGIVSASELLDLSFSSPSVASSHPLARVLLVLEAPKFSICRLNLAIANSWISCPKPPSNPSTCFYSVINERLFYRKAFLSISSVVSTKTSSYARASAFPSLLPANLTGMEFVLLLGAPFSALLSVLPFPCASCQVAPQVDNARPLCPCFKRSKTTRTAHSRVPPKLAWGIRTTTTGSFRLLSCPDI